LPIEKLRDAKNLSMKFVGSSIFVEPVGQMLFITEETKIQDDGRYNERYCWTVDMIEELFPFMFKISSIAVVLRLIS